MQGWQLAGGCRSPHCLYFCWLCHMSATETDDVVGSVPPSYFCIDISVSIMGESIPASPAPGSSERCQCRGCSSLPLASVGFLSGCSLQAVPAPCRLVCVHWSVLRILLSSLELDFWGGEEVLGDVYFVSQKILLTLKAP